MSGSHIPPLHYFRHSSEPGSASASAPEYLSFAALSSNDTNFPIYDDHNIYPSRLYRIVRSRICQAAPAFAVDDLISFTISAISRVSLRLDVPPVSVADIVMPERNAAPSILFSADSSRNTYSATTANASMIQNAFLEEYEILARKSANPPVIPFPGAAPQLLQRSRSSSSRWPTSRVISTVRTRLSGNLRRGMSLRANDNLPLLDPPDLTDIGTSENNRTLPESVESPPLTMSPRLLSRSLSQGDNYLTTDGINTGGASSQRRMVLLRLQRMVSQRMAAYQQQQ